MGHLVLQPSLTMSMQTHKHWELEGQKKGLSHLKTAEKRKYVALLDKYSLLGGHLEMRAKNNDK